MGADMGARGELAQKAAEIRIDHLTKRFGDLTAVRDVSLHIGKGDFFTFLGPSGCGKTTLLRMIAGFTRPDAGDIFFDDQRVNDLPPWRRQVGMVFQNFALWPHMSAFDNVAFGLRERRLPKGEIRERAIAALEMVELGGMEDRRPSQLSGGQQQRVALARTLVVEPRGLLLDEPLSSLDAKLRVQMRNELVRLQRELGITTVYVTHDQEEALALSTRVAVFSRGEVIQEGSPREVYEGPRERSVADFVGTSNLLAATAGEATGEALGVDVAGGSSFEVSWQPFFESVPRPGTPIVVCLRPESLRLSTEIPVDREAGLRGTVQASIYLGSQVQYEVGIEGQGTVRVNVFNPRQLSVLAEGTDTHLSFAPEDVVLLEGDSEVSREG
ncbi:MAG: ABC transporter ATP-binding protein [Candidatus Latescibacteria bacterium]|jgi:iron(III) transport system ATP-binding protein|nr:ABC transporter ATP-binding protein [Candidatus Latescibacterota bacterium]